jgi:hypothetical protein
MRKVLKVSVEGSTEVLDLDAPQGSLNVLQTAVGGLVEVIDITPEVSLWCNEEGKLEGLFTNAFATWFFQKQYGAVDIIVGDVVLAGGVDEEGDTLGLSDEQVRLYEYLVELGS